MTDLPDIPEHEFFDPSGVSRADTIHKAYDQGFITKWELDQIQRGSATIIGCHFHWRVKQPSHYSQRLTRERIEMIQAQVLLGIGDGKTLL